MTAFMDVETVQGPGGEWYVRVPDDHLLCLVSKGTAEAHAEWRECAAVRIVTNEDGTVGALEVAPDLDWLTSPEAER
jgi:hypothetical protein